MFRPPPCPASDAGFTLIELLVAVAVIGILLAIAVPAYVGFSAHASQRSAAADVRAAVPHAAHYEAEHGSFAGMTVAALRTLDSGLDLDHVVVSGAASDTYCFDKTVDGRSAKVTRGAAPQNHGVVVEAAGVC